MERDRLTFVKVAETSKIALGKMKVVEIAEKEVLITNVNGSYYAIENSCTHMHGDLSKGNLEGNTLTCPKHKAKFDVTTGKVISGPNIPLIHLKIKDEPMYAVKVEGENILIQAQ
jgi:3-phenylpropionate/trans-cinnamate dioxygenase ferredoxin component